MNNKSFTVAYLDFAMNAVFLLAILVVILLLLVNEEDAKRKDIEVQDNFLITMSWNNKSYYDLDMHVMSPFGENISFSRRDTRWGTLERDDLGKANDFLLLDSVKIEFKFNREVVHLREIPNGRYIVNVHCWFIPKEQNLEQEQNIKIQFIQIKPNYKILYEKELDIQLNEKDEYTLFSFDYEKNKPVNVDTISQTNFVKDIVKAHEESMRP